MIKKITVGIFLLCISLQGAWQSGKYAGAFLMNPVGSRAFAMGSAFTAVANDVSAIYWNPAGLILDSRAEMTGMHAERFAGMVNLDFFAGMLSFRETVAVGVGYLRLGVDDIPVTDLTQPNLPMSAENRPYVRKMWNDNESALFFTYAKKSAPAINWGVTVKIIQKQLGDKSAWGLGFDTGVLYRHGDHVRLGASLVDATTTFIAWKGGMNESIFPQLRLGAAYLWRYHDISFMPATDFVIQSYDDHSVLIHAGRFSCDVNGGCEAYYKNRIALRAGLFREQFTAGAGVHFSFMQMDYCFSKNTDLGNTHLISMTVFFRRH